MGNGVGEDRVLDGLLAIWVASLEKQTANHLLWHRPTWLAAFLSLILLWFFESTLFIVITQNLNQKRQNFACFSLTQNDEETQATRKDRARGALQSPEETFRSPSKINKKQRIFHSTGSDSDVDLQQISVT